MKDYNKLCFEQLKKMVIATLKDLEKLASGDFEKFADYLDDNLDVEFRIGGNFQYRSVLITFGIGGPGIWFDTESGDVIGRWGSLEFSQRVNNETCDAVDDYFEDYFETCRRF